MTVKEFAEKLKQNGSDLSDLIGRKMPIIVGRMAKTHYQDNFIKGGFVNRTLKKWEPSKRLSSDSQSASSNYGTLLSGRNHLYSSINYTTTPGKVRVYNPVPYASAHNFGETIESTVTPQMRKFAWAKYYEAGGGVKSPSNGGKKGKKAEKAKESGEAAFWKNFALTKKKKIKRKMPKRQFIGESKMLNDNAQKRGEAEMMKILNT